jgi:electron-transferring-flavoprotein dehydrogenase
VTDTMGWPLRYRAGYREFGGSFSYPMGEDRVSIGFVAGFDYRDATLSAHDPLQEFKTHPFVRRLLEGGRRVAWGAKTISAGGFGRCPRARGRPGS